MKYLSAWFAILLSCVSVSTGYSQKVAPLDIVINEVLFNPVKDGYDYVEGYNRSKKAIDLQTLRVAKRNATGDISGAKPLASETTLLSAGGYFIITSNEKWLRQHYRIELSPIVCQLSSMPSLPDDEGTVILLNNEDSVLDELNYSEKWHFALISDASGVALERISSEEPTQDKNNWTSASSSSGYGTPGFQNSHFRTNSRVEGEVVVIPAIFSPDNDGIDDFGLISYEMKETGNVLNLMIYDVSGRRVRYLLKNQLLGSSGQFKWDGLDDNAAPLAQGIYILLTSIFNLEGKTGKFRQTIILARR